MVSIPENEKRRDFEKEVDDAVLFILNSERFKKLGFEELNMNHGRGMGGHDVMNDVAKKVAEIFKEKGYFAHYCTSIRGSHYAVVITKYPTNDDI